MIHPTARTARGAAAALLVALLASACRPKGGADHPDTSASVDTTASATGTVAPATSTAPASSDATTPLTVADVDRWQHGMDGEMNALKAAANQLAQAKSGTDSANAMGATTEIATRAAGARAAGVDEDRYQRIKTELSAAAGSLAPLETQMDLSKMPAAMVEQMRQSHDSDAVRATAKLPADVATALRPRTASLQTQEKALVAERFKAAGMAH